MTEEQYILGKIAEEAGEIVQAAIKAQLFGLNDINPKTEITNVTYLEEEITDLMFYVRKLNKVSPCFLYVHKRYTFPIREEKFKKWFSYAKGKGKIQ